LHFIGCADLLGNGSNRTVVRQDNRAVGLYGYNAGTNTPKVGSGRHWPHRKRCGDPTFI
jgi:hypothetical protein